MRTSLGSTLKEPVVYVNGIQAIRPRVSILTVIRPFLFLLSLPPTLEPQVLGFFRVERHTVCIPVVLSFMVFGRQSLLKIHPFFSVYRKLYHVYIRIESVNERNIFDRSIFRPRTNHSVLYSREMRTRRVLSSRPRHRVRTFGS